MMLVYYCFYGRDIQSQTKKKKMSANLKTNNLKPVIVLRKKLKL